MLIEHLYPSQRLEAGEGGFNASLDAIEDGIEITRSEHVLDLEPGERKLEKVLVINLQLSLQEKRNFVSLRCGG